MKVKLEEVCDKGSSSFAQKQLEELNGDYPIYGASGFIKNIDKYHQENEYVAVIKDGAGIGKTMFLPAKSSIIGTMQYLIPRYNIKAKYLYYAVKSMHLEKYCTGATIPHIYYKDYKKEQFNLHNFQKQNEIIKILEKIEFLIDSKSNQLQLLDNLIKSRFVEMFGDPNSNELKWINKQLKELTIKIGSGSTPKGGKESYIDEGISLIRSLNVYDGMFKYKELAHLTDEQAFQLNNVIVERGDILFNITGASITRTCIVPDTILPARVNQHVSIIRCKNLLNPIFLNYHLINTEYKKMLHSIGEANGATRQAITKQQLEKISIIVPPIELQNEFADFVKQVDKSKFVIELMLNLAVALYNKSYKKYMFMNIMILLYSFMLKFGRINIKGLIIC